MPRAWPSMPLALGISSLGLASVITFILFLSSSPPTLHKKELLTFQDLIHVPECAQDKHCRSACRMVCQEVSEDIGDEADHASSLVAFGCCFNSPLITKQVTGSSFPRETELFLYSNSRKLLGIELRDKHSLRADFEELKRQETALKKRLRKLSFKESLPYKRVTRVQTLMDSEFNGWDQGLTDGEYGWDSKSWRFYPGASQRGWFADDNKTRIIEPANDPFGTEWHYFANSGKAKWKGRNCNGGGCPQASDGFRNLQRYTSHLAAANGFGVSAPFGNLSDSALAQPGWNEPTGAGTFRRGIQDAFVAGLGVPDVDFQPNVSTYPSDFSADLLSSRRPPLWDLDRPDVSYRLCRQNASVAACDALLRAWHEGWEWRPAPCPAPTDSDGFPRPAGCGIEPVARALEADYGYDAARGLASPADIEAGLLDDALSNDTLGAYLGPDLYSAYLREGDDAGEAAAWDGSAGLAHRALAAGTRRAGELRRFRGAYGESAWEWCLAHHRRDIDFPRACARGLQADPRLPTAKPYQSRHKALTAPEEVLEGVEDAFADLLGADREEDVRPPPGPLRPHPNRFQYGAQVVPDGSVLGLGPAPWERIKVGRELLR